MDTIKLIGMSGGKDGTYYEILSEEGRGKTKYWPAIKDGKRMSSFDYTFDEMMPYKVEMERDTVRLVVAGNAVSAESSLRRMGFACLAIGPTTIDVYPEETI